jgi:hypothetical protein
LRSRVIRARAKQHAATISDQILIACLCPVCIVRDNSGRCSECGKRFKLVAGSRGWSKLRSVWSWSPVRRSVCRTGTGLRSFRMIRSLGEGVPADRGVSV